MMFYRIEISYIVSMFGFWKKPIRFLETVIFAKCFYKACSENRTSI